MIARSFLLSTVALCIGGLTQVTAGTFTFSNTNRIIINDSTNPPTTASPYPSTNQVTGLAGSLMTKVTVSLFGFAHTFPSDVDIVLVGPEGQNAIVMSNVGGQTSTNAVTNIDLTLDDDVNFYLATTNTLASGTFKPTMGDTNGFLFDFPSPAPTTSELMGPFLSNFKNTEPNGTWNLFIIDDTASDSGVINGGWSLTINTTPLLLSIALTQTNAILSWTKAAAGYTLQSTPSLSPPIWKNVVDPAGVVSGYYTVTNSIATNRTFYRLAK